MAVIVSIWVHTCPPPTTSDTVPPSVQGFIVNTFGTSRHTWVASAHHASRAYQSVLAPEVLLLLLVCMAGGWKASAESVKEQQLE